MTTKEPKPEIIPFRGQEWEVGTQSVYAFSQKGKFEDGWTALMIRPISKPLREEWQVVNYLGDSYGSYSSFDKAVPSRDYHNEEGAYAPYRIVHMREVRDEAKAVDSVTKYVVLNRYGNILEGPILFLDDALERLSDKRANGSTGPYTLYKLVPVEE